MVKRLTVKKKIKEKKINIFKLKRNMAYFDHEDYYFGGIQEAPFGDPSIFPLRQGDIDKLAPGEGGTGNVDPEQTEVNYTANGINVIEPSEGFDGMSSVKVTVEVPQKTVKDDTVEISTTENGTVEVLAADYDVDGLKEVSVTVNVPMPNTTSKFYYSNGFMTESDDTIITNNSYSQESDLLSAVIGNSVTSIGIGAFSNCGDLASVTIPNSVTSIGSSAFTDCGSLTSIEIPNSVTSIGDSVFEGCDSLNSVTINSNYIMSKNLSMSTIFGEQVAEYIIGGNVTSIGSSAFEGCSSLASVTIGNSVTSIGRQAFDGCSGLTSVTIGNSATSIGKYAFSDCSSLTSITIPDSVTSIGEGAFGSTDKITLESNTPIQLTEGAGSIIRAFGSIESGSGSGGEVRELKIYVPMEAFDEYYNSTDPGWVYYKGCIVGYN